MLEFLKELWDFHKARRKFWLGFAVAAVGVVVLLTVLVKFSARFIYDVP